MEIWNLSKKERLGWLNHIEIFCLGISAFNFVLSYARRTWNHVKSVCPGPPLEEYDWISGVDKLEEDGDTLLGVTGKGLYSPTVREHYLRV